MQRLLSALRAIGIAAVSGAFVLFALKPLGWFSVGVATGVALLVLGVLAYRVRRGSSVDQEVKRFDEAAAQIDD